MALRRLRLDTKAIGGRAAPTKSGGRAMAPHVDVFHAGELAAQRKAGVADLAAETAPYIRPGLPAEHAVFYSSHLNLLYVGGRDDQGRVWASVLAGQPGFISSNGPRHLAITPGARLPADPLPLGAGATLGALGLDLATRRRNRVAGTVAALDAGGTVHLRCEQTVGNCPKYIQTRNVRLDPARLAAMQRGGGGGAGAGAAVSSGPLGEAQLALIRAADTFFLASSGTSPHTAGGAAAAAARGAPSWPHAGCDVSHRGGPPGFVEMADDGLSLRWPDYAGNNMFMSLGNLEVNPAAGLLFIDWLTGDVLQLSGQAHAAFTDRSMPGAQRVVAFTAAAWAWHPAALPIRPAPVIERSPYNPRPPAAAGAEDGGAEVECVATEDAAAGIKTFRFRAPPGFAYTAGQYASFDFPVSGGEVLTRTWTLSSHPSETASTGAFAISVKRVGLVSGWLHDRLRPGASLLMRGVGGDFVVQQQPAGSSSSSSSSDGGRRRALLLAGGIGITPMRAMFLELVARGAPASLLYSVRHPEEAAFLAELAALAHSASSAAAGDSDATGGGGSPAFQVLATATATATATAAAAAAAGIIGGDAAPGCQWRAGRLDAALVREAAGGLALAACDAYVCGPTGFMAAAAALLEDLGVDPARIHTESFTF